MTPPAKAAAAPPLLFFRLGEESFSLPLSAVREVALPGHLSRIPRAPEALPGVMNLRGRIVVVADLGLLLRNRSSWTGKGTERLVVLDEERHDLALLVSEVLLIGNLGEEEAPLPPVAAAFTKEELADKITALLAPALI